MTILLEASNLYESDIVIWFKTVPGWILSIVHIIPMIWHLYLTHVFCRQFNYDLGIVSGAFCISSGIVQILTIYVCLMQKKDLISDSIDLLRGIVRERKKPVCRSPKKKNIEICAIFIISGSIFVSTLGSNNSPKSRQIYEKMENYNNNLAKYLFYFTSFVCVSLCTMSGLMPIWYAVFGFPDASGWLMPLPAA